VKALAKTARALGIFWPPFQCDTSLTLLYSFGTRRIVTCRLHFRSLAKLLNLRFFPATQHQPWPLYCNQISVLMRTQYANRNNWNEHRPHRKARMVSWTAAVIVTLLLTLGQASFLLREDDPLSDFPQAVRGLIGLVLIFDIYTLSLFKEPGATAYFENRSILMHYVPGLRRC
jgi:hypothetical protein